MKAAGKITVSAIVIALYVVLMFVSQGFAFGQYQIRIVTAIYSLSYVFPFLILPLGISNFLSNTIMGGLGPLDMLGGFLVGIITSSAVYLIGKMKLSKWLVILPIIFIPGLMVPIWLSYLLNIPYMVLAPGLCIGQVLPAVAGVFLIQIVEKYIKRDLK